MAWPGMFSVVTTNMMGPPIRLVIGKQFIMIFLRCLIHAHFDLLLMEDRSLNDSLVSEALPDTVLPAP